MPHPPSPEEISERTRAGGRRRLSRWGPPGNERLTSSNALVLFVLLAVETVTTLSLRSYLPVHIFLGLLLLPPVGLKLASTGWRFARYYTRNEPYRLAGPPRLLLRLLAPLLVGSTASLFGTGVAMIVVGHGGGLLLTLHALSFVVWGPLTIVHVLAYLGRVLREGPADWQRSAEHVVAGVRTRRALVVGAFVGGAIVALATYPAQRTWLGHRHHRRRPEAARSAGGDLDSVGQLERHGRRRGERARAPRLAHERVGRLLVPVAAPTARAAPEPEQA